jgi:hypothetical protein
MAMSDLMVWSERGREDDVSPLCMIDLELDEMEYKLLWRMAFNISKLFPMPS